MSDRPECEVTVVLDGATRTFTLENFQQVFTNPAYLLLVGYFTLPSLAGWVVRDWMPAILKQRFEITQGASGVFATLPMNVAALGAAAANCWRSRSPNK